MPTRTDAPDAPEGSRLRRLLHLHLAVAGVSLVVDVLDVERDLLDDR